MLLLMLKLMMMMMKFFDIVDADYKSQILPNFQINCLRTLLPKQRPPPPSLSRRNSPLPDLKGFFPGFPGSQLMQNSINFCRMKFYANQK